MENLYLVELIEYYFDSEDETIHQDEPKILGLYKTEEAAKEKINLEVENYKKVANGEFGVLRDEELNENCIEALDLVSDNGRVTLIANRVLFGDSDVAIDYNRVNYFFDYDNVNDEEMK